MAFDELNQVGKSLRLTREEATIAVNRYAERIPIVERIRDSIDANNSFVMRFEVPREGIPVRLDLNFLGPLL